MNKYIRMILLSVCVLLVLPVVAWPQATSESYGLVTGGLVCGGGVSTSDSYALSGNVPLPATGMSASDSYALSGGIIAIAGGEDITFIPIPSPVEIIPVAQRTVKVAVQGGTDDVTGTFHFRYGGQSVYSQAAMTGGVDDTMRYIISADHINVRVMEYYFEMTRGTRTVFLGNPGEPYQFITEFTNAQGQRPAVLPNARFRIVGVPVEITGDRRISTVFEDDLGAYDKTEWRMGMYVTAEDQVTEFPGQTLVQPGQGYWLIARGSKRYGAAGLCQRPNWEHAGIPYYRVPYELEPGWNQVANPFPFDIAWADIKFDDNGNIVDSDNATVVYPEPFAYNGGFAAATVIYGWDGVFIYAEKAGVNMLWPYREAGTLVAAPSKETPPIAASATSWQIELSLEANDGIDRSNFAGVHTGALDGPDCYDQYDPPPPPDAPQLSFELSGNQPPLRCADFRAPYNDGAEWQVVIYKAEDRKLTINGLNNIPPDMEAWLILDIGQTINLDDNRTIALPNDVTSARLIIGTSEYASKEVSEALPDDYALYQNFPNPFNPTTTIRYALPADGHVRLEIINLLGQVVTMLVDEKRSAGVHTVDWDGRDGGNQSVASGIYFYRLVSGQYTANRKMVLLK